MVQKKTARPSLRIIAGSWRGRRLSFPAGTTVRPTPDRVRETVFNWLAGRVEGARCLDLYAGTGMMGLEALSRGAAEVWFVERNRRLAEFLGEQLESLEANGRVIHENADRFVERRPAASFDIVFLDPPYELPIGPVIGRLAPLLAGDAFVYLERAAKDGLPDVSGFQWHRTGRAGAVCYGLACPCATAV